MSVAILVPRRADGGYRDVSWEWVKRRWEQLCPEWKVFEGHHDDGPFNRSAAINAAAEAAGEWDVAVVSDADSFASVMQIHEAIERAKRTGHITYAFSQFCYLDKPMSEKVMRGYHGNWWTGVAWTLDNTVSSQVVVPRSLWDEVGGFDPGFIGWGMEDVAFSEACETLGGGGERVDGVVWHLWHPASTDPRPLRLANRDRLALYHECGRDPEAMRSLIAELRSAA